MKPLQRLAFVVLTSLLLIVGCEKSVDAPPAGGAATTTTTAPKGTVPDASTPPANAGGAPAATQPANNGAAKAVVPNNNGAISGLVTSNGAPLENWLIQVFDTELRGVTDKSGKFEIAEVPVGEHLVNVLDGKNYASGVFAIRILTVPVRPNETVHLNVEFGNGQQISGSLKGLADGEAAMIMIRRDGGPLPEDIEPRDRELQIEASKFVAAYGSVRPGGEEFTIIDVEPGTYSVDVISVTPIDPSNPTPPLVLYRKRIVITDQPITLDIQL